MAEFDINTYTWESIIKSEHRILGVIVYSEELGVIADICGTCMTADNHWEEGSNLWCNTCSKYVVENGVWIYG